MILLQKKNYIMKFQNIIDMKIKNGYKENTDKKLISKLMTKNQMKKILMKIIFEYL